MIEAVTDSSLARAASILKQGGLVAFPTETVYGLGADALKPECVARIFEAKKRPFFDPLIVHAPSLEAARVLWRDVPESALRAARQFWPGPLTLVLPKSPQVPDIVTSGLDTVAVRVPQHPAALGLLERFGGPIAAPSANLFGRPSATTAQAVEEDLGNSVDLILDAGEARIGVESTVVKIDTNGATVLRPGGLPLEELQKYFANLQDAKGSVLSPESPGLLETHYAPLTPMFFIPAALKDIKSQIERASSGMARRTAVLAFAPTPELQDFGAVEVLSEKGDLREAAHRLFGAIRRLDKKGLQAIIALGVPPEGLGLAILDRLRKASSGREGLPVFLDFWKRHAAK